MVVSKEALAKIRKIIHKHYASLIVSLAGSSVFSEEEKAELEKLGVSMDNPSSLLELIYFHNVLNQPDSKLAPISISEMKKQQKDLPKTKLQEAAVEHTNHNFKALVEDLRSEVQTKVEQIIRNENYNQRNRILNRPDTDLNVQELVAQSTVGQIKQKLRDYTGDADRNWQRIAITEVSNAIGMASVDRIIAQNPDKIPQETYVYKIIVDDAATCKYCRKFFVSENGTPRIYKFSDIISNGTNFGKKASEWQAVAGPIHPNCRESGLIEIKPGWKVVHGGKLEYIGLEKWPEYIRRELG